MYTMRVIVNPPPRGHVFVLEVSIQDSRTKPGGLISTRKGKRGYKTPFDG